jgi:DNA-binding beta-propeller fold protein YncE
MQRAPFSVFVCDRYNNRICEFAWNGQWKRTLDVPCGLSGPRGICLSPDEKTLAVADRYNYRVVIINLYGRAPPQTVGHCGSGPGMFTHPFDVAFTPDGKHLVVADSNLKSVQVLGLDGSFVHRISCNYSGVRAVAVDGDGNILIHTIHHLKVFSPTGKLLNDSLGGSDGHSAVNCGLAVDPGGINAVANSGTTITIL